ALVLERNSWLDILGGVVSGAGGGSTADEVMMMVLEWWRRVVASGVVDLIDRLIRRDFGFGRKARRKSFSASTNGGGGDRLVAAENMGERGSCVLFVLYQMK
nr:hypothetical protein [Tanacetum cinerariifolium]